MEGRKEGRILMEGRILKEGRKEERKDLYLNPTYQGLICYCHVPWPPVPARKGDRWRKEDQGRKGGEKEGRWEDEKDEGRREGRKEG